jgi:hypothetical protein
MPQEQNIIVDQRKEEEEEDDDDDRPQQTCDCYIFSPNSYNGANILNS